MMKNILAILFLFVTVKAHVWPESNSHASSRVPGFQTHPGYNHGRSHNPFLNFNWHQRHNDFSQMSFPNADWVCRNPKTGDMMIITNDNSMDRPTSDQHWQPNPYEQNQHYPTGQTGHHYPWPNQNPYDENHHENPNGSEESNHNLDHVNIDVTVPTTIRDTNNNDEATKSHGGEGLIDVRMGER